MRFKCPDDAVRTWAKGIKVRLALDLIPAQANVRREKKESGIELELRMSGMVQPGAATVTLSPAIWILCASKYTYELNSKSPMMGPEVVRKLEHANPVSCDVKILADATNPIEGCLLPNSTGIWFAEGVIATRKIELSATLCKFSLVLSSIRGRLGTNILPLLQAEETSGAWVVHGDQLYGLIVAVYKREPYAHMIPSNQLYHDISKSFPVFVSATIDAPRQDIAPAPLKTGEFPGTSTRGVETAQSRSEAEGVPPSVGDSEVWKRTAEMLKAEREQLEARTTEQQREKMPSMPEKPTTSRPGDLESARGDVKSSVALDFGGAYREEGRYGRQLGSSAPSKSIRYSCPFRKRNPLRFNIRDYPLCATQPLKSIEDVW